MLRLSLPSAPSLASTFSTLLASVLRDCCGGGVRGVCVSEVCVCVKEREVCL